MWVSDIETVPQAIDAMEELFDEVLGWDRPAWLGQARALWCGPPSPARARVAVPIWRDPWMVVGRDTFTGDLLARAGLPNVFADHADRYPSLDVAAIDGAGADVVLLPDEPYVFTADRRAGGVHDAHRARRRAADHVVRPVARRGPRGLQRPARRRASPARRVDG